MAKDRDQTPPSAAAGAQAASAGAQGGKPGAMTGAVKAALWLLSAEEEVAVGTLKLLTHDEVRRLREAAETIARISPEERVRGHREFKVILEQQPLRLRGSLKYLGRLATQAWGEATAQALLRPPQEPVPPATVLQEADTDTLAASLGEEHPQIIAAVLTTLPAVRASALLERFDEGLRAEVLSRLARLKRVPQSALVRAQQLISNNLPVAEAKDYDVDGVRLAATVLNEVGTEEADRLLTNLATEAETLATSVRSAMFTFEDLSRLDRRGLQALLKDVPADRLLLALKAASDALKGKIFEGLSKRAAEMMQEDLQAMGPTKLSEVEAAQADIVTVALRLRDEGKITIVGAGGGGFV
jgi:flagellar motor switch protein FliG